MATSALETFIRAAPHGAERVLAALAEAESLTDLVAGRIYDLSPIEGISARLFVKALHYSSFVAPRNSEWHIEPQVRKAIKETLASEKPLKLAANELLLHIGETGDPKLARTELPGYLFTPAGRAFHLAAIGRTNDALGEYSNSAMGPLNGEQWLAGRLADEQERAGVIPRGSVEVTFLRAMVFYRSGRRAEAQPLFRELVRRPEVRIEIAIASHLLGNMEARRSPREAESILRRAVSILEELNDRRGLAQTLHSLANLLARDRSRAREAEETYRRGISIDEEFQSEHDEDSRSEQGLAQALHSLANLLARDRTRTVEAEEAYRRSLLIDEKLGNEDGVSQTLHSLANFLSRDRTRTVEAEEAYRRSISIGEKREDQRHIAQTLHSLANLLSRDRLRADEAEEIYRQSLLMDEKLGNEHGVAQTLHSLANLLSRDRTRAGEAEEAYKRSLSIGEKRGDQNHIAQTLRSFADLVEQRSPSEAEALLNRSLSINLRNGNQEGERLVLDSLAQLRRRHPKLN